MARSILAIAMATILTACTSTAVEDSEATQAMNPVLAMDEVAISGAGKVHFVSGNVTLAQYPAGGDFSPASVGADIRDKTMLHIGSGASVKIKIEEIEVLEFAPAPKPRSVMLRVRPLNKKLQPTADASAE